MAGGAAEKAQRAFREAIRIKPEYADARSNLASVLEGAGRTGEARAEFEEALALRPSDAATRYNYAMLLGRARMYDAAQRELEECLRTDGEFREAHQVLGDLLMGKGQAREAAAHFREVLRMKPDSGRAQLGMGVALAALGDKKGAVAYLGKASKDGDAGVRAQAAEVLRQMGR